MLLIVLNPTKREGQEYALGRERFRCPAKMKWTAIRGHIPTRNSDQKIV
jgi:hypothetical protein